MPETNGNGGGVIQEDVVSFIKKRNAAQSIAFTDPGAQISRQLYRAKYPTEILALKCMDGRLNLALYTETPPGIIQPFRNIGGKFDLGWPFLQEVIRDSVGYAIGKGRRCLILSSYHFSKGDHHRGCAGFGYDTEGAKQSATSFCGQCCRVFGDTSGRGVYAVTIGIETDEESLIFHGVEEGSELRVADLEPSITEEDISIRLQALYPDMHKEMIRDLVPLIMGNVSHIAKLRASGREPIDLEHREQIIAVGRGFDWLHMPNKALIIGPYSHAWPDAVRTAGTIVLGNIKAGRVPAEHGILLMIGALHRQEEGSSGLRLKEEKVKYLLKVAEGVLREDVPELAPHLKVLGGVVSADTRLFTPVAD